MSSLNSGRCGGMLLRKAMQRAAVRRRHQARVVEPQTTAPRNHPAPNLTAPLLPARPPPLHPDLAGAHSSTPCTAGSLPCSRASVLLTMTGLPAASNAAAW